MTSARLPPVIAAGGVALACALFVALALGEPLRWAGGVIALALAGALVAEGLAALLLLRFRSGTVRAQALVAALVPTVAVATGTGLAAAFMLVSVHDLLVLLMVLVTAGTVGVVAALMVARRVTEASRSLQAEARRMGGRSGALSARPAPQRDQLEEPAELADLREQLRATSSRLERARASEEAADAARRDLVSWVSHDLRTPIADIRALVEALEDHVVEDAETVRRYHRTILVQAERLGNLVDDLFDLSRIHAGSLPLTIERVPVADLVSDTLATLGPVAEARGVGLEGRVAGPGPEVDVSLPEMMRVLHNLLDNALRHTAAAGRVLVEARTENPWALVSVLDDCGGIPDDELSRVFEVSFRGDAARSARSGAGLGLAIAEGLAQAHGGAITVENVEGGCCFTLRLPLAGSTATSPPFH
jgi:signal transduction histidine kinase